MKSSYLKLPLIAVAAISTAIWIGCTSAQKGEERPNSQLAPVDQPSPSGTAPGTAKNYESQVEQFSDGEAEYSGFYNNFEYKATLLNSVIRAALLQKQNEFYQWDREKFMSEREKSDKEMSGETTVFLSFFTPDRKNDNLTDQKSIWRVYIEAGGKRYQGKAKRIRTLLAELQALYPYHTRWNTAYTMTFPMPTSSIEALPTTLTVTGPLGTKTVHFPSTNR